MLQSLIRNDLSREASRFAHSREIEIGYALLRASWITYVSELAWQLQVSTEFTTGATREMAMFRNWSQHFEGAKDRAMLGTDRNLRCAARSGRRTGAA